MTSKDDDTLPLPGFSQELSIDASVDEDFIPTTQPHISDSSKTSRTSESKYDKCTEEQTSSQVVSFPRTEEMPSEPRIDQSVQEEDKSLDFIPDTETKKATVSYSFSDISCKKKLQVFSAEDSFKEQANTFWGTDSPGPDTQSFSIVNDTPTQLPPPDQESLVKREESIPEIIVNDSAETVDLEQTPVKIKISDSQRVDEKSDVSYSVSSDVYRCEETQLFDSSSVLLLDQPGSERNERSSSFTSERLYLQETVDDNLQNDNAQGNSSAVAELSKRETEENLPEVNGNIPSHRELQHNPITAQQDSAPVVVKKFNFKLTVEEIQKPKPTPLPDTFSDNMSDKSKRHSTSSSGSAYSDKTALPFALHKRVSTFSDVTDSSEEEFMLFPQKDCRIQQRIPWSNEYLLPLKMDDILQGSIENQELLKRPNNISSPRKHKARHVDRVNHLKEILESSSSERTTVLENGESQSARTSKSEEMFEKEESDNSPHSPENENKEGENLERSSQSGTPDTGSVNKEKRAEPENKLPKTTNEKEQQEQQDRQTKVDDESSSYVPREGLPVLARWTDKRYYSGILSGRSKNDKWEVKFDDGATKMMWENFILPTAWLKVGALVFVLVEDEYKSGQIVDIKQGDEFSYVVQLDEENKKMSAKLSDLYMTEVMVSIIREKYKPMGCTPRGKVDIDCDNVLSGKRLREHKTPSKPPATYEKDNSGSKKKSSSKAKKTGGISLGKIKETPQEITGRKLRGLRSESGHLVEDKGVSADSPSETEGGETPLRGSPKEPRRMTKPRSLSYDHEEARSGRKTSKSYLTSDGTPVPGTSGVKFKKRKINSKQENVESPADDEPVSGAKNSKKAKGPIKQSQLTDKPRRKRKLEESYDDSPQKSTPKDGSSRPKRKNRN